MPVVVHVISCLHKQYCHGNCIQQASGVKSNFLNYNSILCNIQFYLTFPALSRLRSSLNGKSYDVICRHNDQDQQKTYLLTTDLDNIRQWVSFKLTCGTKKNASSHTFPNQLPTISQLAPHWRINLLVVCVDCSIAFLSFRQPIRKSVIMKFSLLTCCFMPACRAEFNILFVMF